MTMLLDRPTTTATDEVAEPLPLMDQAEALLLEVEAILVRLNEHDRFNLGYALEKLAQAGGTSEAGLPEVLAEFRDYIGPDNRASDHWDREDAAKRRAAVTHADAVERYARIYHADGIDAAHRMIESDAVAAHGEELAYAIGGAAFQLYLHQKHDHGPHRVGDDCLYCEEARPTTVDRTETVGPGYSEIVEIEGDTLTGDSLLAVVVWANRNHPPLLRMNLALVPEEARAAVRAWAAAQLDEGRCAAVLPAAWRDRVGITV